MSQSALGETSPIIVIKTWASTRMTLCHSVLIPPQTEGRRHEIRQFHVEAVVGLKSDLPLCECTSRKAPRHRSRRGCFVYAAQLRKVKKKKNKTHSDTTGRADGGGFTLEAARDPTLGRRNDSCRPITAAARLPPQLRRRRRWLTDSLTRVYKPPVCVLWSGGNRNTPQLQQIKVDCSCAKKGKMFSGGFFFVFFSLSIKGSSQNGGSVQLTASADEWGWVSWRWNVKYSDFFCLGETKTASAKYILVSFVCYYFKLLSFLSRPRQWTTVGLCTPKPGYLICRLLFFHRFFFFLSSQKLCCLRPGLPTAGFLRNMVVQDGSYTSPLMIDLYFYTHRRAIHLVNVHVY